MPAYESILAFHHNFLRIRCGFTLNKVSSHKKDKVTGMEGYRKYHFNLKFKEFVDQ